MCRIDPCCRQCGSEKLLIVCKRSKHRWNITQTCGDCHERVFIMEANLADGMARLPRPEPMQAALDIPRPRERYEYK